MTVPPVPETAVTSNDEDVPGTGVIPGGTDHRNVVAFVTPVTVSVSDEPWHNAEAGEITPFPPGAERRLTLISSVLGAHPFFEMVQRNT